MNAKPWSLKWWAVLLSTIASVLAAAPAAALLLPADWRAPVVSVVGVLAILVVAVLRSALFDADHDGTPDALQSPRGTPPANGPGGAALVLVACLVLPALALTWSGCGTWADRARTTIEVSAVAVDVADHALADALTSTCASVADLPARSPERAAALDACLAAHHYDDALTAIRVADRALRAAQAAVDAGERADDEAPWRATAACVAVAVTEVLAAVQAAGVDVPPALTTGASLLAAYTGTCESADGVEGTANPTGGASIPGALGRRDAVQPALRVAVVVHVRRQAAQRVGQRDQRASHHSDPHLADQSLVSRVLRMREPDPDAALGVHLSAPSVDVPLAAAPRGTTPRARLQHAQPLASPSPALPASARALGAASAAPQAAAGGGRRGAWPVSRSFGHLGIERLHERVAKVVKGAPQFARVAAPEFPPRVAFRDHFKEVDNAVHGTHVDLPGRSHRRPARTVLVTAIDLDDRASATVLPLLVDAICRSLSGTEARQRLGPETGALTIGLRHVIPTPQGTRAKAPSARRAARGRLSAKGHDSALPLVRVEVTMFVRGVSADPAVRVANRARKVLAAPSGIALLTRGPRLAVMLGTHLMDHNSVTALAIQRRALLGRLALVESFLDATLVREDPVFALPHGVSPGASQGHSPSTQYVYGRILRGATQFDTRHVDFSHGSKPVQFAGCAGTCAADADAPDGGAS